MVFNRIKKFHKDLYDRGTSYYSLGKDIFDAGYKVYKDKMAEAELNKTEARPEPEEVKAAPKTAKKAKKNSSPESEVEQILEEDPAKLALRKNLEKNFTAPGPNDPAELARQTSLKSHQVINKDPSEKLQSNMWQRNFENHQGN